jgi:hypothetical protein
MPSLEGSNLPPVTKLLLIGDSGTGKTGALASLVKAGYRVRILDMDNKVANGILPQILKRECPDKIPNVDFEPLRDKLKSSALGYIFDGQPAAFVKALALLDKWSDGTLPKDWGPQSVLVIDSLTFFSDAAFNWAKSMNPSAKDPRQWYGTAQDGIESTLAALTTSSFATNVIVISHVSWVDRPDGSMKGYPSSVGKALGPTIPAYFDNMALCQTVAGKRTIQTVPTALVDLKNPAAFKMAPTLPIETGLADFFATLRS